jgi:hypothetical protein
VLVSEVLSSLDSFWCGEYMPRAVFSVVSLLRSEPQGVWIGSRFSCYYFVRVINQQYSLRIWIFFETLHYVDDVFSRGRIVGQFAGIYRTD